MMKNKYKVLIISCWILLILAMILKLFGVDWFIATSENKRFIKVCDYIDNHFVVQSIVQSLFSVISCSIYYMAVLREERVSKHCLTWFIPLIIYSIFKGAFQDDLVVVFFVLDIFMMIGLPIIINKKIWKLSIIGFFLNLGFQLISMLTKMNNYDMFDDNTLIYLILNIDYYIMLVLFYLYVIEIKLKKKGGE